MAANTVDMGGLDLVVNSINTGVNKSGVASTGVDSFSTTDSPTYTNLTLSGLLFESNQTGITAGTTRTQAGATALTKEVNRVDTSTAPAAGTILGDGVVLMAAVAGLDVAVINNTANIIQVYGNGSDTINGTAGSTGIAIPPGDVAQFEAPIAGTWYVEAGVGSSGQLPVELAADNISAAGSTQAAATNLTAVMNKITTATTNQGVRLPTSASGLDIIIENHSGAFITVYGAGTDTIDDIPTATGFSQMDSSVVIYTCYAAGKWYTNGGATGYAKNPQGGVVLETMQYADNISAAGTTQGTATQLLAAINTVSTVASGTGVNLPASAPGLQVNIINTGANPLLVYPAQGASDTINGIAAATGVSLFPGVAAQFNCTLTGAWTTQPSTTKSAAYNTVVSAASLTLTAAQVTGGGSTVDLSITGSTAITTFNTPTAAQIVAVLHSPTVGTSYRLKIINTSGTATSALTAGTGVTLASFSSGVHTIANGTWREYVVTVTAVGTPAVTMTSVATGTWS